LTELAHHCVQMKGFFSQFDFSGLKEFVNGIVKFGYITGGLSFGYGMVKLMMYSKLTLFGFFYSIVLIIVGFLICRAKILAVKKRNNEQKLAEQKKIAERLEEERLEEEEHQLWLKNKQKETGYMVKYDMYYEKNHSIFTYYEPDIECDVPLLKTPEEAWKKAEEMATRDDDYYGIYFNISIVDQKYRPVKGFTKVLKKDYVVIE
jgi:hypothetical protein